MNRSAFLKYLGIGAGCLAFGYLATDKAVQFGQDDSEFVRSCLRKGYLPAGTYHLKETVIIPKQSIINRRFYVENRYK